MTDATALGEGIQAAFERLHREVFVGDPVCNRRLHVEVHDVQEVAGIDTAIVVAPWTIAALAVPRDGGTRLPSAITLHGRQRPLLATELDEIGRYSTIPLTPDVLAYADQESAVTAGTAAGVGFRRALREAVESATVASPSRRKLLSGRPEAASTA